MAVIQTKESNGLLSALGAIGTIGGAAFGAPWLSALGMGANMMNGGGMSSGQGGLGDLLSSDTMKDLLDKISGAWKNPASGSIATPTQKSDAQINDEWQKALIAQYRGGNNPWGQF